MGILNSLHRETPEAVAPEPVASVYASYEYKSNWNIVIIKKLPTKQTLHNGNDGSPTEVQRVIKTAIVAGVPSRQARQGQTGRGRQGDSPNHERTHPYESQATQRSRNRRRPRPQNINPHQYNDLCVAVTLEPYSDLNQRQAETIKNQLEGMLDEDIFTPSAFGIAPQFRGKAFFSEGVLKVYCNDQLTISWLRKSVTEVPTPWEGRRLVIRKQSDIPKTINVGIMIPQIGPEDTLARIHARLICQNPHYTVDKWNLYSAELHEGKKYLSLVVGIPEADAFGLLSRDRRVFYRLGNLYVRFLEEGSVIIPNLDNSGSETEIEGDATASQC